jgi:hypothetical protein
MDSIEAMQKLCKEYPGLTVKKYLEDCVDFQESSGVDAYWQYNPLEVDEAYGVERGDFPIHINWHHTSIPMMEINWEYEPDWDPVNGEVQVCFDWVSKVASVMDKASVYGQIVEKLCECRESETTEEARRTT